MVSLVDELLRIELTVIRLECLQMSPNNAAVRQELELLKKNKAEYKKKEKELYATMFKKREPAAAPTEEKKEDNTTANADATSK
jgi:hypothetical protein